MVNSQIKKLFFISASTLSALGLMLAVPSAGLAQEMTEDVTEDVEAVEDTDEFEATGTFESEEDGRVGQSMEIDDSDELEADMDSEDIDSDYDYEDSDDVEVAPTYSNSPRALW